MTNSPTAYRGVRDCFYRILKEEGVGAFYRSLPPRLMSVVPMMAIQFGIYETLKTKFQLSNRAQRFARVEALKKKTLKSVKAVRTSAVAIVRTARKRNVQISIQTSG
jgi:Mitochondrial carrier protein